MKTVEIITGEEPKETRDGMNKIFILSGKVVLGTEKILLVEAKRFNQTIAKERLQDYLSDRQGYAKRSAAPGFNCGCGLS